MYTSIPGERRQLLLLLFLLYSRRKTRFNIIIYPSASHDVIILIQKELCARISLSLFLSHSLSLYTFITVSVRFVRISFYPPLHNHPHTHTPLPSRPSGALYNWAIIFIISSFLCTYNMLVTDVKSLEIVTLVYYTDTYTTSTCNNHSSRFLPPRHHNNII